MSDGIVQRICAEIAGERICRVIDKSLGGEGFSRERDSANYKDGQLAMAAAVYAAPRQMFVMETNMGSAVHVTFADPWPWHGTWLKRTNRRADLIKAAALIVAEIERIDREIQKVNPTTDGSVP